MNIHKSFLPFLAFAVTFAPHSAFAQSNKKNPPAKNDPVLAALKQVPGGKFLGKSYTKDGAKYDFDYRGFYVQTQISNGEKNSKIITTTGFWEVPDERAEKFLAVNIKRNKMTREQFMKILINNPKAMQSFQKALSEVISSIALASWITKVRNGFIEQGYPKMQLWDGLMRNNTNKKAPVKSLFDYLKIMTNTAAESLTPNQNTKPADKRKIGALYSASPATSVRLSELTFG